METLQEGIEKGLEAADLMEYTSRVLFGNIQRANACEKRAVRLTSARQWVKFRKSQVGCFLWRRLVVGCGWLGLFVGCWLDGRICGTCMCQLSNVRHRRHICGTLCMLQTKVVSAPQLTRQSPSSFLHFLPLLTSKTQANPATPYPGLQPKPRGSIASAKALLATCEALLSDPLALQEARQVHNAGVRTSAIGMELGPNGGLVNNIKVCGCGMRVCACVCVCFHQAMQTKRVDEGCVCGLWEGIPVSTPLLITACQRKHGSAQPFFSASYCTDVPTTTTTTTTRHNFHITYSSYICPFCLPCLAGLLQVSGNQAGTTVVGAAYEAGGDQFTAGLPNVLRHSPLMAHTDADQMKTELCNALMLGPTGGWCCV